MKKKMICQQKSYMRSLQEWFLKKFDIENVETHSEIKNNIPKYRKIDNLMYLRIWAPIFSYYPVP